MDQFCKLLLVTALLMLHQSCVDDQAEKLGNGQESETDTAGTEKEIYYQIPSPVALFEFVSLSDAEYQSGAPAPLDLSLPTSKQKALVLGFYLADLTYELAFKNINRSGKLLDRIAAITRELHISGALEDLAERTRGNLTNYDSLKLISSDTYEDVHTFLEDKQRGATLSLIVAGAWIEGLCLALNTYEYAPGKPANQRVADQKITFENMYALLKKHKHDKNVQECIQMLQPIQMVFDEFSTKKVENENIPDDPDVIVVGKSEKIFMSQENYAELKRMLNQLRASIIDR